jgi:3-hydroxyacyl-[acyl-carrier-protein] dehydratase
MSFTDEILPRTDYDLSKVVAGVEEIRRYNPQRYEMEQLSAIVLDDPHRMICVGYKDLQADEFWTRGHMPGKPLMPGVLMCEVAAQCCSYFTLKHDLLKAESIGFGGMEEIRFRHPARPGDRLVVIVEIVRVRTGAMVVSRFQEFVGENLVAEGTIKGVPFRGEITA